MRHYRDKRQEAGYHLLDRSRLEDRDLTVSNMRELEETLSTYRGWFPGWSARLTDNDLMTVREWCDISNFPSSHTATFPRVRPCSQVMTSGLQQPLTIRKVEHS